MWVETCFDVIPNSFAEGEGVRGRTPSLHHHERQQDYVHRFFGTIQPPGCPISHRCWEKWADQCALRRVPHFSPLLGEVGLTNAPSAT
jgi:hypothetical protein